MQSEQRKVKSGVSTKRSATGLQFETFTIFIILMTYQIVFNTHKHP